MFSTHLRTAFLQMPKFLLESLKKKIAFDENFSQEKTNKESGNEEYVKGNLGNGSGINICPGYGSDRHKNDN